MLNKKANGLQKSIQVTQLVSSTQTRPKVLHSYTLLINQVLIDKISFICFIDVLLPLLLPVLVLAFSYLAALETESALRRSRVEA